LEYSLKFVSLEFEEKKLNTSKAQLAGA